MNVICRSCKTQLNIPDHKIPAGKEASVTCPKCKAKIAVQAAGSPRHGEENKTPASRLSFEDRRNALICVGEPNSQKIVYHSVSQMGFEVNAVKDSKTAINRMAYHIYHLVVLDEMFDQGRGMAAIMDKMNTIDMSLRRRMCLVLLSTTFQSNDNMATLHASVNNILNIGDIGHVEAFLKNTLSEHNHLYTVYNESLKLLGKA